MFGIPRKVYKVNSSLKYTIPQNTNIVSEDASGDVEITMGGYCHDVTTEEPIENVYIMYTPYPYMSKSAFVGTEWGRLWNLYTNAEPKFSEEFLVDKPLKEKTGPLNPINFTRQSLVIKNDTDRKMAVFIIVQGEKGSVFSGSLNVSVINTKTNGEIIIYSNVEIDASGNEYDYDKDRGIMKTESGHQDKLVKVTVTVSNEDVERTISSTIQK